VEIIFISIQKHGLIEDKNHWKKDFSSSKWDITEEDIKIPSWKIEKFG
jgi:hypothetical protein